MQGDMQGELRWLTPKEVAALMRVSPETVRRWLRKGKLVAIRPGHMWFVAVINRRPVCKS